MEIVYSVTFVWNRQNTVHYWLLDTLKSRLENEYQDRYDGVVSPPPTFLQCAKLNIPYIEVFTSRSFNFKSDLCGWGRTWKRSGLLPRRRASFFLEWLCITSELMNKALGKFAFKVLQMETVFQKVTPSWAYLTAKQKENHWTTK